MLTLLSSATSPFARKARIVLAEKKVEFQLVEASPWVADTPVAAANPLCKVPVLTLDDGTHLFDSRVIVDYVDSVSPVARLIPEAARQRVAVRRWEALADGICDALVLAVLEGRRKAAQRNTDWITRQRAKIDAGVAEMARELEDKPWCNGEGYTLADIATGCALGYIDLRYSELDWRDRYPNLAKLAEKLGKRPAFAETAPPAGA
ncbi:MAG: glutathione S-transferase N-terminal domain-containing protein [Proteobacteria bacterium]|nr:glutathione S-transferase N-terminal domain-containing protein [Pseudomonadota bacterium]